MLTVLWYTMLVGGERPALCSCARFVRPIRKRGIPDVRYAQKIFSFAAAFGMTALLALPAQAQWGTGTTGLDFRPRISTAEEVAITQHWLSGVAPSAEEWARHSKEYKEANDFSRQSVIESKKQEYIQKFRLFTKPETIAINSNVKISRYSQQNKGFVIESFNNETFFAYTFAGKNYAIIVPKLMDYQWLGIEGQTAQTIENVATNYGNKVNLVLEVEPKTADKTPIKLGDKEYLLMSAEIATLSIYLKKSDRAVWTRTGTGKSTRSKSSGDLLDFYGKR